MTESVKSSLDQTFVGNGCSSPLRYYYECHTAGALETVLTRDDSSAAGENRDDDNDDNDAEPLDLPPVLVNSPPNQQLHKPKAKRPLTVLDKTNQSVSTASFIEHGLLATAKGDKASSCVVGVLEAHKHLTFENQSTTSSSKKTPTKEKKQHKRFAVTVPIYASSPKVGTGMKEAAIKFKSVHDGNEDQEFGCAPAIPSTSTAESRRAKDAIKVAAAARWRAAKKRHIASASVVAAASASALASASASASASSSASSSATFPPSAAGSKQPKPNHQASASVTSPSSAAAPEEPKPKPKPNHQEDIVCVEIDLAEYDRLASTFCGGASTAREEKTDGLSWSRRQAVDPPADLSKLPTEGVERQRVGSSIEGGSPSNHQRLREEGLFGGEITTTSLPPLFRKFSEALRQMEDEQEVHRSRLFKQRLRHQKRKSILKERAAALLVEANEEHKETAVVGEPAMPAVFLIPVDPC